MTRYRKKIITFLVAIALGSGVLVAFSVQSSAEQTSPSLSRQSKPENSKFKAGSLFTNDPNFSTKTTNSPAAQELFFKTMFAVLMVVVLGAAAIYISRKLLPRITNLPGKQIHILETAHLGPRKAVHLIEIGDPASREPNQRLLIGSTNENISTLAHLGSATVESGALSEFSSEEVENNLRI